MLCPTPMPPPPTHARVLCTDAQMHTQRSCSPTFQSAPVHAALQLYSELANTWRVMLQLSYERNWDAATSHIPALRERSLKYLHTIT